ncbi:FKBP12-associated protein, partial [Coemansia sp. S17]
LLDFTRTNTSWVRGIENLVAAFIADTRRSTLRFVSMKQPLREFLHAVAPFYGCASRSVDYEPHRSVCWDRSPTATIPSIILSSAIRYTHAPQIVCSLRASDVNDSGDDGPESDNDGLAARKRQPIDYIAIRDLRHGLTADELSAEIRKLFPGAPFTTRWKDEDLVEVYCTDSAAKHEHLPKWLSVLKKKLPHLGVAGLVTAQVVAAPSPPPLAALSTSQLSAAVSARIRRDSSSSSKQPARPPVKEPETPEAWDDESVPENWESLNLSDS